MNPQNNHLRTNKIKTPNENRSQLPDGLIIPFELVSKDLSKVDDFIREQARSFDPGVEGYVSYVCDMSGKRIRPALAILAGGATGEITNKHLKIGSVVELVHLATLIHDDIMDDAEIRREMPTVSAKWGSSLSVLLGDCLFARALELATEFEDSGVCRSVANAASAVCQGEILQTQRRFDLTLTREEYFHMIESKTGALFAVSTELGSRLSGASKQIQNQLYNFGMKVGTAYQIYDDCVDLVGKEESAGKTLGTDLTKGKLTLPVLNLIASGTETQRKKLNERLLLKEPIDVNTLAGIADYDGAIQRAVLTGKEILSQARDHLVDLNDSPHQEGLVQITNYLETLFDDCNC